jgi:hypothetical protein
LRRPPRSPIIPAVTTELDGATKLLDAGDLPASIRALRPVADTIPLRELAQFVRRLAAVAGYGDLAAAAKAVIRVPDDPARLYDFGYASIERGVSFLAVPALRLALERKPGPGRLLTELVSALEREHRHGEAADALGAHEEELARWPEQYLLTHNTLLAGDLATARARFGRLGAPDDPAWEWAHGRLAAMVARARLAESAGPLDPGDLRGWHYTLTGGFLTTLSPYGHDAGMTGRYAFLQDSAALCRQGLDRLVVVLRAAGREPASVSLLPGPAHRVLGIAAAELLGLPHRPYDPRRENTLVVAHDLTALPPGTAESLAERPPGQLLFEHATRWTEPPPVSADVTTLLHQTVISPWGRPAPGPRPVEAGTEAELVTGLLRADGTPDPGDGRTPPDGDEVLTAFVTATAGAWATGPRHYVGSPGPVPSSRF